MSMKSKLRADLISAGEGAFWLAIVWITVWGVMAQSLLYCLIPLVMSALAAMLCLMHRPTSIALRRYRVRASRTEMWWHLLVIPLLLALVIWTVLESLLGDIEQHRYKLVLLASLSATGWLVYILTIVLKRVFQSLQNKRKK